MASKAAQAFVNQRLSRYGEVRTLKIDSRAKQIELVCHLIGEPATIDIRIDRYELHDRGTEKVLRVGGCTCNRPWLQNLLSDYLIDREFPVPSWAASAL